MSEPLTWTVSPSLPPFLELVESEEEGGTLQQVAGAAPTAMDEKVYTVTAGIKIAANTLTYDGNITVPVQDLNSISSRNIWLADQVGRDATPRETPRLNEFESYEDLMNNAPPLFLWQQDQQMDMPDHYTCKDRTVRGSLPWYCAEEYFPRRKSPTPQAEGDSWSFLRFFTGAEGFIAREVYQQGGRFADYIDTDYAQGLIDGFSELVWESNFELSLSWLKWEHSKPVTGGLCSLEDYKACITSPFWISEKKAQQASGTWANQSREMFLHFLKLQAVGATDAEIASIYKTITAPSNPSAPALDPSGFGDESSSYLQVSVDREEFWHLPGTDSFGLSLLDHEFLHDLEVWDEGSCCRAGTLVLMGDQKSLRPIETIQPGDWVSGSVPSGNASRRRVAWVSRPSRSRRPLYALRDRPAVWFTSSHPIHRGVDDNGLPIIGFVHPQQAVHLNPTWAAWTIQAIPSTELVQLAVSHKEEILYDLVFEPGDDNNSEIIFYTLRASKGQDLVVGTEATNSASLPATAAFVLSLAIADGPRAAQVLEYVSGQLRPEIIKRVHHHARTVLEKPPRPNVPAQQWNSLYAIEAFVQSVGLSLEVIAHNGWQYQAQPPSTSTSTEQCICLSTHFLQFAQPDTYQPYYTQVTPPQGYANAIKRIRRLIQEDTAQVSIQASREYAADPDPDPAAPRQGLQPKSEALIAPIGPHMFRLRADLAFPNTQPGGRSNNNHATAWAIRVLISTASERLVLYAKGALRDGRDVRWPVYILPGGAHTIVPDTDSAIHLWHVGFLTVSQTSGVLREKLQAADRWGLDESQSEGVIESESSPGLLVRYMWSLGEALGKDTLKQMSEESDMAE
ncbi:uncharacterized protein BDV17DRAFT_289100 [Aspergillus undulatus]|uniref:uncharacterized protein n=1 Tax=Aspergillus undulatus TaxID=1810928 RepID=UPI003CCD24A8